MIVGVGDKEKRWKRKGLDVDIGRLEKEGCPVLFFSPSGMYVFCSCLPGED